MSLNFGRKTTNLFYKSRSEGRLFNFLAQVRPIMTPMNATILCDRFSTFRQQIHRVLYGGEETVRDLTRAFLAGGHALITGVPGVGKSLVAQLWGELMDTGFTIKTMTSDVLPSEITGSQMYNPVENKMVDVFGLFDPTKTTVLADEINRTPPKVQNAMLEVMNDRRFIIAGTSYPMGRPFFVMACRNPVSQRGTYPLVEALTDRMYVETFFGYTSFDQGVALSQDNNHQTGNPILAAGIKPVMSAEEAVAMQDFVREQVQVSPAVAAYITRLIFATRPASELLKSDGKLYEKYMPEKWQKSKLISYGCSNRAIFMLTVVAKAEAALNGRTQVTDADVKAVAPACLPLKLVLNEQLELRYPMGTNRQIIIDLLKSVPTT